MLVLAVVRPRFLVSPYSNHPVDIALFAISPIPLQRALLLVIWVATLVTTLLKVTCTGGMYTGVLITGQFCPTGILVPFEHTLYCGAHTDVAGIIDPSQHVW
jgi:hypothetical protein